jgi:hypothetical protein
VWKVVREVFDFLKDFILNPGWPPALWHAGEVWTDQVGGPTSSLVGETSLNYVHINDHWQGAAAVAYKNTLPARGLLVVTAPLPHSLPAGVSADLRRRLGRDVASSAALVLLFAGGAAAAVLIARHLWSLGLLLAVAYLAGAALACGVLLAALRGQHAIVAGGIAIAAGRRAQAMARSYRRLSRIAAALTAAAAVVDALLQGDVGLVFVGVLCVLPLLSLASVARGVDRHLASHLPNRA